MFALSDGVLFPGIVLPLQLSEPLAVSLVHDAMAEGGFLGVGMERKSKQSARGFYKIGCLARIVHLERDEDGSWNVLLRGMQRVRLLQELVTEKPYRCFKAEALPPCEPNFAGQESALALARFYHCLCRITYGVAQYEKDLLEILHSTNDLVQLVDTLSAVLIGSVQSQQQLLETIDFFSRIERLSLMLSEMLPKYVKVSDPKLG